MKGINVMFLIAVLIFVVKTYSQEPEEEAQHFCGRKLAETLSVLCYEEMENSEKRSLSYNSVYEDELPRYWPWVPRHLARGFAVGARGKRQFIVDECCKKACTLKKLTQYC